MGERREETVRRDKVVLSLSLCAFRVLAGGEAAGCGGAPHCCSSRKSPAALAVSQPFPALPQPGGGGKGRGRHPWAAGAGHRPWLCSGPRVRVWGAGGLGSVSLPLPSTSAQDGADVHRGDAGEGLGPLPSPEQTLSWGQGQGEEERCQVLTQRGKVCASSRGAKGRLGSPVVNSSH